MLPPLILLRVDNREEATHTGTKQSEGGQKKPQNASAPPIPTVRKTRGMDGEARNIAKQQRQQEMMERKRKLDYMWLMDSELDEINKQISDDFPQGQHFNLDGFKTLLGLPRVVLNTLKDSKWIFSSNTFITGIRTDATSEFGEESQKTNAFDAIRILSRRFANKPHDQGKPYCGETNCFEGNFSLGGDSDDQKALKAMIYSLNSANGGPFEMPADQLVSVRAPKQKVLKNFSPLYTRLGHYELSLTLYMANSEISPRILAAFPVDVHGESSIVAVRDYAYVTESSWVDFARLLDNLSLSHQSQDELHSAVQSISKAVVNLMRLVAQKSIILTDLKLPNMVARRVGDSTEYEVRMIDFGALFTADVNMHAVTTEEATPEVCTFILNGLLLANFVASWRGSTQRALYDHRHLFRELVKEVVDAWRLLESTNTEAGLCTLLMRDTVFPLQSATEYDLKNLVMISKGEFQSALSSTFYRLLHNYGKGVEIDLLRLNESMPPESSKPSYISRLVGRMAEIYGLGPEPNHEQPVDDDEDELLADKSLNFSPYISGVDDDDDGDDDDEDDPMPNPMANPNKSNARHAFARGARQLESPQP